MKLRAIESGSKGNSCTLISENEILLLETGCQLIDIKEAINLQIGKVVGCPTTHTHRDRIGYVKDFLSPGMKIYANDEVKEVVDYAYGERLYGVLEKEMFKVGGLKATPFYTLHNDIPNYRHLAEHKGTGKLLFATDFKYLPWTFKQRQLNHMLTEYNHTDDVENTGSNYERIIHGHSSLSTVLDVVCKN